MSDKELSAAQGGTVPDEKDTSQAAARPGPLRRLLRRLRPTPEGRKRLVRFAIVALVVVVVVIVPGYVALQPAFLTRYPDLGMRYRTWSTSTHAKTACQSCHVPPTVTAQGLYAAKMVGVFYASLVTSRQFVTFDKPTTAACARCHVDLRTVAPAGDLLIPHRAHVTILKMDCVTCHQYLVHELSPEGTHTPRMVACQTCHNGTVAKDACSTCHTAKAAPATHAAADWVVVHPQRAAAPGAVCATCHGWTKDWCADCHARRPRSHTLTWRTTHAAAVKVRRDCEVCHTASFCTRCHGVVPQLNFDPALQLVK